jgi:6-pyruvoyltetrahydropterin/6-carboxytetrahydropterin synthase
VEVSVAGEKLDENGMLIDFRELRLMVEEVVQELDHQYLNELSFFNQPGKETNPTAENIAHYIYRRLKSNLKPGLKLVKVNIWESSTAWACYSEEVS